MHTAYRQGGDDEWSTNVDGSAAVAAAAARGPRLVHISSDLVFDGARGRYLEDGRAGAGERLRPVEGRGGAPGCGSPSRATIVRTSLIYGGAAPGPQERLAREGTRFFVDEIRSPVQVGDLAEAVLELLGARLAGPLHLGGADDISRYDFALLLGADPASDRARAHDARPGARRVARQLAAAGLLSTRLRGVRVRCSR